MSGSKGVSLIELLISLVIISLTFVPLVMSQITSLKISTRSALSSQVKAAATQVMEQQTAKVLKVDCGDATAVPDNLRDDNDGSCAGNNRRSFFFLDYFHRCPTYLAPPTPTAPSTRTAARDTNDGISCGASSTSNLITTTWSIVRETGITGEGLITITVVATHTRGLSITTVNRISCFDVYPSPQTDSPAPCPIPL